MVKKPKFFVKEISQLRQVSNENYENSTFAYRKDF